MPQSYDEALAEIRRQYEPRILTVLSSLGRILRANKYLVGAAEWRGVDCYAWEIPASTSDGELFKLRIQVHEQDHAIRLGLTVSRRDEAFPMISYTSRDWVDPLQPKAVGEHYLAFEAMLAQDQLIQQIKTNFRT